MYGKGGGEEGEREDDKYDSLFLVHYRLKVWLSESDTRVEKGFNPAVFPVPPANHNLSKVVVS